MLVWENLKIDVYLFLTLSTLHYRDLKAQFELERQTLMLIYVRGMGENRWFLWEEQLHNCLVLCKDFFFFCTALCALCLRDVLSSTMLSCTSPHDRLNHKVTYLFVSAAPSCDVLNTRSLNFEGSTTWTTLPARCFTSPLP